MQEPTVVISSRHLNKASMKPSRKKDGTPRLDEDECFAIARKLGLSTNIQARNITGGFGNVFITEDENLNRKVAVKVLFKNWHRTRLEREWNAVRTLCAEKDVFNNLVTIYASGEDDRHFFYTMECANNCAENKTAYEPDTLERRIRHRAPSARPSPDDVWTLFNHLMAAVQTLHSRHMAHLDIKPDNIYCIGENPKLGDYSLITSTSVFLKNYGGSPGFFPENRRYLDETTVDGVDCDLYALGKVLYNYVTKEAASNYPKLPHDYPDKPFFGRINNFLLKACNASEEERFHDIQDFRKGFERCFPQKRKRRIFLSLILPLAFVVLVALLDVHYRFSRRSESIRRQDLWYKSLEKSQQASELLPLTMPADNAKFKTMFSGTLGFNDKSFDDTKIDIFEADGRNARHFSEHEPNSSYFMQTENGLALHLEKGSALELPVKLELPGKFEFAFLCTGSVPCKIQVILQDRGFLRSGTDSPPLTAQMKGSPFMADIRVLCTGGETDENAVLYVDGARTASCSTRLFSGRPLFLKLVFEAEEAGDVSISMFKLWESK